MPVSISNAKRTSKMPRANLYAGHCPSRTVLDHVTSRWGALILILLLKGPHRFSQLARDIGGVSEKMLAQSLRLLVQDGFVLRTVYSTVPPSVEYSLTRSGTQIASHVNSLADWIETNLESVLRFRKEHTTS